MRSASGRPASPRSPAAPAEPPERSTWRHQLPGNSDAVNRPADHPAHWPPCPSHSPPAIPSAHSCASSMPPPSSSSPTATRPQWPRAHHAREHECQPGIGREVHELVGPRRPPAARSATGCRRRSGQRVIPQPSASQAPGSAAGGQNPSSRMTSTPSRRAELNSAHRAARFTRTSLKRMTVVWPSASMSSIEASRPVLEADPHGGEIGRFRERRQLHPVDPSSR
jgi:hypothetical protein